MRAIILAICLLIPTTASAQVTSTDPRVARIEPNADTITATQKATSQVSTTTLAGGTRRRDALMSKNEAYNISRAAEGRVGVRLGNDMSFRIGK
jgi:hypothetical protein